MTCVLSALVIILVVYALVAYIRRKIVKPNYNGKLIWITGASSGIGEYLAYEFNKNGASLILTARNTQQLKRVQEACSSPDKVSIFKLDMTDYPSVQKLTTQILSDLQNKGQKLDMVVQNAGISMRCEFVDYSFENHKSLFDVNVHGPYKHLQLVVPHMIKNKCGHIVGVSSQAGKLATAYRTSYAGSKHAFIGILDSLRTELKPFNIRVCNIMPGYIKTNISKNAMAAGTGEKFGKTDKNIESGMDADKFAKEAVGAIFNNENEVSIGEKWLPVFGMVLRNLCPDLAFKALVWNAKNQSKAVAGAKTE